MPLSLLKILKKRGFDIKNITDKAERIRDVGKNKNKPLEQRFTDIQGVHKINIDNLNGEKVLTQMLQNPNGLSHMLLLRKIMGI